MKDIFKKLDRLLWYIKPRFYPCRDVIMIRWMNKEYIIKWRENR